MKLNQRHPTFLNNVFLYDINACHYNIMKNNGYDISNIDFDNKLNRNKEIGKMMRTDRKLTKLLAETTRNTIDEFIKINDINDDDIVIRQYDGIIVLKACKPATINGLQIEERYMFSDFLESLDRKSYVAYDRFKNKIVLKGIPFRYEEMDQVIKRIITINFSIKEEVFNTLEEIKQYILRCNDINLFSIPSGDSKFIVHLKDYGELLVAKNLLKLMPLEDIDKKKYFDQYIKPFSKSLTLEFLKGDLT